MRYELADDEWIAIKPMLPRLWHERRPIRKLGGLRQEVTIIFNLGKRRRAMVASSVEANFERRLECVAPRYRGRLRG